MDTHLYGMPDWKPSPGDNFTVHTGFEDIFKRSWFVVHKPTSPSEEHTALVAIEEGVNEWRGFWTYNPETVKQIDRFLQKPL